MHTLSDTLLMANDQLHQDTVCRQSVGWLLPFIISSSITFTVTTTNRLCPAIFAQLHTQRHFSANFHNVHTYLLFLAMTATLGNELLLMSLVQLFFLVTSGHWPPPPMSMFCPFFITLFCSQVQPLVSSVVGVSSPVFRLLLPPPPPYSLLGYQH